MNKFDIQYSNRYSLNCSYCRNVCIQDFIRKFQNLFDDISKLYKILFDPFTNFRKSNYQAYNGTLGKYFFIQSPLLPHGNTSWISLTLFLKGYVTPIIWQGGGGSYWQNNIWSFPGAKLIPLNGMLNNILKGSTSDHLKMILNLSWKLIELTQSLFGERIISK